MGDMLGWDAARTEAEVAAYQQHVREVKTFLPDTDMPAQPRVAHG